MDEENEILFISYRHYMQPVQLKKKRIKGELMSKIFH